MLDNEGGEEGAIHTSVSEENDKFSVVKGQLHNAKVSWLGRRGHRAVLLPGDQILLGGGYLGNHLFADLFLKSPHETLWKQVSGKCSWERRAYMGMCVLSGGKIVVAGGGNSETFHSSREFNDIWHSADQGLTWNLVTDNAPWCPRSAMGFVALQNGGICLFCGVARKSILSDCWLSVDGGLQWSQQTVFVSPRFSMGLVELSSGEIITASGFTVGPHTDIPTCVADCWLSRDRGQTWIQQIAEAPWKPRAAMCFVARTDGLLILAGGENWVSPSRNEVYCDAWVSEDKGCTWSLLCSEVAWGSRFNMAVVISTDIVFVMGGCNHQHVEEADCWTWDVGAIVSHMLPLRQHHSGAGTFAFESHENGGMGMSLTTHQPGIVAGDLHEKRIELFSSDMLRTNEAGKELLRSELQASHDQSEHHKATLNAEREKLEIAEQRIHDLEEAEKRLVRSELQASHDQSEHHTATLNAEREKLEIAEQRIHDLEQSMQLSQGCPECLGKLTDHGLAKQHQNVLQTLQRIVDCEQARLLQRNLCRICCDREIDAVVLPCGHQALCFVCATALEGRACPFCRQQVQQATRLFKV